MAHLSPRTVALRTALVNAMAAADVPLSTEELRDVVHPGIVSWRHDPRVYQQLRALERMGICRRQRFPGVERRVVEPRYVYWKYTQDEAMAAVIAQIEEGAGR